MEHENIPQYVKLSEKNKILNPYYKGEHFKFYGNVDDFDFEHQTENYNMLTNYFTPLKI